MQEVLVGVLAAALRRHAGHGAFNEFEQGLLHALTRHVARDGGVVRLARNFVNFIDVNNAALRTFYIVVAALKQLGNNVFHVFAHITGFGQGGGIGHDKRHIQHARQGLRQQGFARACGANQQDVALGQLDVFFFGAFFVTQTLVMVVHRHGQGALGFFLPNDVVV